jgi:Tfp pilus assembly protein PilF
MLGSAVFVLVFAVALTAGRGAMLVLVAGMGVLTGVAWGRLPRAVIASFSVLVVAGLIAGNIVAHGRTTARMVTLIDPTTAGWGRFVIWEWAWRIITESPWLGKGLGSFGLVFPRHQNPLEGSAGFMAHNDYLQIWLEAGLPGVILLLAIYISALVLFVRVLRSRRFTGVRVIEIAGLFCGLLVVAMHSFVNFNLYVLPTSLVAGVMLARFHELATARHGAHVWVFKPTRYIRLNIYRPLVVLVVIAGIGYWISQALANYAFQEAVQLVKEGELDRADLTLSRAQRLSPDSEMVLVARAELYRHVIAAAPVSAADDKRRLFASAIETLDRAEKLNPYRADIPFLRSRLQWLVKTMAGENWKQQTVRSYEQSIRLQPRFYTARVELASFWLEQGQPAKAREVLEQGMAYEYVGQERILPYYRLTAALRRQAGEIEGARQLEQRTADILSVPQEKRILSLDQVKFFSFYDLWRWFLGLFGWA